MFEEKSGMSSKTSFLLGLAGGVLVLCTVGFFVLLGLMMSGKMAKAPAANNNYAAAPNPNPNPSPSPSPSPSEQVGTVAPVSDDDHVQGSSGAEVTLYEWSDFECPFCERFHPTIKQLMADPKYKGKVRWVYRHFPLSFHPQARPAANASECAAEQGKFFEYADELFANQSALGDTLYAELATKLKLNKSKFDSCYSSRKYDAKVSAQMQAGSAAGVTGTPGTVIVGKDGSKQLVPGAVPLAQLQAMVDVALGL